MKRQVLFMMLFSMICIGASAHDIAVANADGVTIYYNYSADGKELIVTFRGDSYNNKDYSGVVVIPEEVTYMNRTRKVTSIRNSAFYLCSDLTSITIPNSVTSIGNYAFSGCSGLTSIKIPNSVTSIGERAFSGCSGLTSVTIGNSVMSIGNAAFYECYSLKKVIVEDIAAWCGIEFKSIDSNPLYYSGHLYRDDDTEITELVIPEGVTSIGDYAFQYFSGLTSVTIPNSVTSIGERAFSGCSGLTSVTIPNSVTSIGDYAFRYCSTLTSITIGNSVKSIGISAFYGCTRLTSITIPNSVTSIGSDAFNGCNQLSSVVSLIENPFPIFGKQSNSRTFTVDVFNNATLYVPVGPIDKYKATEGWKDFVFIEEGTGGGDTPEPPTPQKCATPTISFKDGKLVFGCETEGVTYVCSYKSASANNVEGNNISLPTTYTVTVYAKKDGFLNSDTVTEEVEIQGASVDLNGDGVVDTQDVLKIYQYIQEH